MFIAPSKTFISSWNWHLRDAVILCWPTQFTQWQRGTWLPGIRPCVLGASSYWYSQMSSRSGQSWSPQLKKLLISSLQVCPASFFHCPFCDPMVVQSSFTETEGCLYLWTWAWLGLVALCTPPANQCSPADLECAPGIHPGGWRCPRSRSAWSSVLPSLPLSVWLLPSLW